MYQFANFDRAEIGPSRLPELADGFEGVIRMEKAFMQPTRFGDYFRIEFTIMASNHPENPVEQRATWKQDMTKKDICNNSLLSLAAAVMGVNRDDKAAVERLKQAMNGLMQYAVDVNNDVNNFTRCDDGVSPRYICAQARESKTKQAERDFLFVNFWPYVVPQNGG